MSKQKYETQFSIYKLDYERTQLYFLKEREIEIKSFDEVEDLIYKDIKEKLIARREEEPTLEGEAFGFRSIFFKTNHRPVWSGMASQFVGSINENKKFISNSHISYVLTYKKGDSLYLLTGGLGSNYISDFVQKNYGLYLLPKLISDDLPAVKSVLENRLTGNRLSDRRANRNSTTINVENELATIFRELSLEFGSTIISELNIIEEGEKPPKLLNVIAKDSLVVRKSLSLDKLANMIEKLNKIEQLDDSFSLGYLVPAKKYDYSSTELKELMINYFKDGKYDNFILVGSEICEYYLSANKYIIKDSDGNIILENTEPIKLEDVYFAYFKQPISRSRAENFLRLEISTYDDGGVKLPPTKLKDCLQGYVENEKGNFFYLFSGDWLVFDPKYVESLGNTFKKQYASLTDINNSLTNILKNNGYRTEDDYNLSFEKSSEVILAHTVRANNIELADLIYYDDNNDCLYLVHNKGTFNGAGSRDLMNQIITSVEFINNYRHDSLKRKKFFEDYFKKIKEKYPENAKINSMDFEDFFKWFDKKICYVAGFLYNLSDCVRSNYAKYITIDVNKRLNEKNFELKLFDIKGSE